MALSHFSAGALIDVQPYGQALSKMKTAALFKTPHMELMRLVLPAGKKIATHQVPGEIIVQCLEGVLRFETDAGVTIIKGGQLLYLEGAITHALEAIEDASVLVTILLPK